MPRSQRLRVSFGLLPVMEAFPSQQLSQRYECVHVLGKTNVNPTTQVKPRWAIPLNAIMISLVINCLLPIINIGSTAALNAIFSLSGVSILSSYIICIGALLLKRVRGEVLPSRRWTLGKFGMGINIAALAFLVPLCVFMFFPPMIPVTELNMNWGCLMYGAVVIFATIYYVVHGKNTYTAPVDRIRRDL